MLYILRANKVSREATLVNFMPYSKKVLQAFKNPKHCGKIKNPDGIGKVGNIYCGDVMWLYIKIGQNKKKQEIIKDVRFETFGCIAAIASSNIIAGMVKGKTIEYALKLTKDRALEQLGGLPPIKVHCSVLAVDALKEAIYDYLRKNKKEIPKDLQKRHVELEKERKAIEKKYKAWVKKEEQLRNA